MNSNQRMIELYQEREEGFEHECLTNKWELHKSTSSFLACIDYRKVEKKIQCMQSSYYLSSSCYLSKDEFGITLNYVEHSTYEMYDDVEAAIEINDVVAREIISWLDSEMIEGKE